MSHLTYPDLLNVNVEDEVLKHKADLMLLSMLGSADLVETWWGGQNAYFDLQTPESVWQQDPVPVYTYILNHYSR
jgi:hypothetical protein